MRRLARRLTIEYIDCMLIACVVTVGISAVGAVIAAVDTCAAIKNNIYRAINPLGCDQKPDQSEFESAVRRCD